MEDPQNTSVFSKVKTSQSNLFLNTNCKNCTLTLLGCRWCVAVLNVHIPPEDDSDDDVGIDRRIILKLSGGLW